MRGINIDVVKGYYKEMPGKEFINCVNDPSGLLIDDIRRLNLTADNAKEPGKLAMRLAEFEHQVRDRIVPGVVPSLNFVDESDIISTVEESGNIDVGYLFLRASLQNLQAFQPNQAIYVRLIAPQNWITFITICPRKLLESIYGEIYPGTVMRHLVSVPHPVKPGSIMVTPYYHEGTVRACSYKVTDIPEDLRLKYGRIICQ